MGVGGLESKFKQGAFERLFCGLGGEITSLGKEPIATGQLSQI